MEQLKHVSRGKEITKSANRMDTIGEKNQFPLLPVRLRGGKVNNLTKNTPTYKPQSQQRLSKREKWFPPNDILVKQWASSAAKKVGESVQCTCINKRIDLDFDEYWKCDPLLFGKIAVSLRQEQGKTFTYPSISIHQGWGHMTRVSMRARNVSPSKMPSRLWGPPNHSDRRTNERMEIIFCSTGHCLPPLRRRWQ